MSEVDELLKKTNSLVNSLTDPGADQGEMPMHSPMNTRYTDLF